MGHTNCMLETNRLKTKRVLVYRLGSLGDTVIALPLFHLVARSFPNAERKMLTSYPAHTKAPSSSAILQQTGLIHSYYRYSYGTRNFYELLRLWWSLITWRPEVLVYMSGPRGVTAAKRDLLFFRMCGIRYQVGVPLTEDMQRHHALYERSFPVNVMGPTPLEYECSRLARNLRSLGDACLDRPESWSLHLTKLELAKADDAISETHGQRLIAASVGTKMQSKDWGRDNWAALMKRVAIRYPDCALVLCGAAEESEASEFVASAWRSHSSRAAVNLCGLLTPRESAAVFLKAKLFIGHDSGPMHLAAAVQTPCVAVFSSRNMPRVWYPYGEHHRVVYHQVPCQNCNLETCVVEQKKCIMSITVEEVLKEILLQLPTTP